MRIAIIIEAHSAAAVEAAVWNLQLLDELFLKEPPEAGRSPPPQSRRDGPSVREESVLPEGPERGREHVRRRAFCSFPEMIRRRDIGFGADFDDIAPAHAALLRVSGVDPMARGTVLN